jgi:hypothetical protein
MGVFGVPYEGKSRGIAGVLAGALAVLGVTAGAAHAGPLVASAPDCAAEPLSQPFTPWLDPAQYQLAPDGAFEAGAAGWTLAGGAATVADNEDAFVHGPADRSALSLPSGARARSATVCVGIEHPTIRFFVRRAGAAVPGAVRVDVLFEDATGAVQRATIGTAGAGSSWAVTPIYPIVANLLPLLPGDHTPVAFVFTPLGTATWQVDDVYVDPWGKG